jgi:hypothetical protein
MLGQQVHSYQAFFRDIAHNILGDINTYQREANRAFVPVIAKTLAHTYKKCIAERGKYTEVSNLYSSC